MENASKALIMAAGMLISLMIISIAVYLFISFGQISAEKHQQIDNDRLNQFNSQFTTYEPKDDLTIYDVISIANLATDNNKYFELNKKTVGEANNDRTKDNYIFVGLKNKNSSIKYIEYGFNKSTQEITNEYNTYIRTDLDKIPTTVDNKLPIYKCKTFTSQTSRRVYKIEFYEQ